jgi:hypothetical protein
MKSFKTKIYFHREFFEDGTIKILGELEGL